MKAILIALLATVVLAILSVGLGFLFQGSDFVLYRYFAPKYEGVRRETFENSKAYRQGMVQELQAMRVEYVGAKTQEQRDTLASVILHRTADFDTDAMPPDLRDFVVSLRRDRLRLTTGPSY